MTTSVISPKFQIVIPKEVRETLDLQSGQKVQIIPYQNRIELVPIWPIQKARGFLRGIDTDIQREEDRI